MIKRKDITTPAQKAAGLKFILETETFEGSDPVETVRGYKKVKCNMPNCNKSFWTELDPNGVAYKKRCERCSNYLKQRGNPREFKGRVPKFQHNKVR